MKFWKFFNFLISKNLNNLKSGKLKKFLMWKNPKNFNMENSKKSESRKFQKFSIWEISKISNLENSEKFKSRNFQESNLENSKKFPIWKNPEILNLENSKKIEFKKFKKRPIRKILKNFRFVKFQKMPKFYCFQNHQIPIIDKFIKKIKLLMFCNFDNKQISKFYILEN